MNVPPVPQDEIISFDRAELDRSIVERFSRVAALRADHTAVSGADGQLTYRALDARSNRLANAILQHVSPGVGCVTFMVDHSPEMIVCVLAILKAGKAYHCLHPAMPRAARRDILRDAAPDLLIVSAAHRATVDEAARGERLPLLSLDDIDARYPETAPSVAIDARDPAVIFYTSGSTGQPKGVLTSHRTVLHRAWLCAEYDHVRVTDRLSLLTGCSFASSQADLFGALLNGAALELYDIASRGLVRFGEWIDQRGITVLHPPVALFRRYLAGLKGSGLHPSVRLVSLAGEAVTQEDVAQWRQRFALSCGLRHRFSSTEAGHIAVACIEPGETRPAELAKNPMPVTDKHLSIEIDGRPVAQGVAGELVVRSAFMADGYWRRPPTPDDPFRPAADGSDQRAFRTGDIGRLLADGSFEFLGRQDNQVKIRGYRVELHEIEQVIVASPMIAEAAVVADSLQGKSILVAYVVAAPGADYQAEALRSQLWALLPPWKIPSRIQLVAALPLTATGKVDKQRLRQGVDATADADAGTAP